MSLAWFTYDTEFPTLDATANLSDPGHRWLTAVGPIEGNQVLMDIEMTSGGIFDAATESSAPIRPARIDDIADFYQLLVRYCRI